MFRWTKTTPISETNLNNMIDMMYPVGSIYLSVNDINPQTIFGGTWEQIKDRFLLSAGDTYAAGTIGGEAKVTLTIDQIPSHKHTGYFGSTNGDEWRTTNLPSSSGTTKTNWEETDSLLPTGGGQSHNNMPPYLAVYMWKRTS